MATPFGTDAWAQALLDEINDSSEYRNAGAGWGNTFNGNLLFVFEAGEGLPSGKGLLLRLKAGSCLGAEFVDAVAHPEAGFVLRAPFPLWKEILERRTMAATAILTGKMKVEGDRMMLLRHAAAHKSLIHCTSMVDTVFPGG